MPRPKKPGAPEPKRRSRNGCWPCKARKVKCGEERPCCLNCQRSGESCDYSIRLNWDGRRTKKGSDFGIIQFDGQGQSSSQQSTLLSQPSAAFQTSRPDHAGSTDQSGHVDAWSTGMPSGFAYVPASTSSVGLEASSRHLGPQSAQQNTVSPRLSGSTLSNAKQAYAKLTPLDSTQNEDSGGQLGPEPPFKRRRFSPGTPDGEISPFPPIPSPSAGSGSMSAPSQSRSSLSRDATLQSADYPSNPLDDESPRHAMDLHMPLTPEPFRRMSVNSLLSGEMVPSQEERLREAAGSYLRLDTRDDQLHNSTYYGIDRGFRDLDVGKNDDRNAITGASPKASRRELHESLHTNEEEHPIEFGFGAYSNEADGFAGGYYDRPVIVRIPRSIEPLPDRLRDNPMNLLYFHHFLNHTSRVLVPHDDPGSNPFRTVLPLMAVTNDHLLSLLLAYSASHRARLLQQDEPATRIALWVQDIFPALRHALNNPDEEISNANVATAIMLASLEIISPSAFEVHIPWQKHLTLARELVTARPALLKVNTHSARETQAQGHQVCAFLWSWFAYLDVLGSLSGGAKDASPVWVLEYRVYHPDDDDEIDCIMGFTTRCIYILARIAELAKQTDAERLREKEGWQNKDAKNGTESEERREDGGSEGSVSEPWRPSPDAEAQAEKLEADVRDSMAQPPRPCQHIHGLDTWDRREMIATNEAYHWAALIHLWRRVQGVPTEDQRVQEAVDRIFECLRKVRCCGSAEGCLLFPMFTAGCETRDEENRAYILERMTTVEKTGMTQVNRARRLMEKVWEVGQPWEELLSTEFIG